jgi:hypothetical protein
MAKVIDITGKKGSLVFLDQNLMGEKRIMVKLRNDKGEVVKEAFCSTTVTQELRSGRRPKDGLMNLNIELNEAGRWIIQRDRSNEIVVNVADLTIEEAVVQTVSTFEEAMGY